MGLIGLIVVAVVGGIIGWLASIVTRTDAQQGVLLNIAVGIVGALIAGLLVPGYSILNGISLQSTLASFAGAVALLAIVNLVRRGRVR